MRQYKLDPKPIGKGSFGVVYQATHLKTEKTYAIKLLKHEFETSDDVHRLPEVQVMRRVGTHPNILRLHEVLYNRSNQQAALVTDLMKRDLYQEMCQYKKQQEYIPEEVVCHYLYFLLKGVQHLHKLNIFHRDLKPENVLVDGEGGLKIADLGSVKGIFKKPPHTEYTATRWYRAPEVLLSSGCYGYKMDLWAVGCIFFELMALDPLFPGDKEDSTLELIHAIRGTPSKAELAQMDGVLDGPYVPANGLQFRAHKKKDFAQILHFYQPSEDAIDLLEKLLCYAPNERISAKDALKHRFFAKIRSLEKEVKKTPSPLGTTVPGSEEENTPEKEGPSAPSVSSLPKLPTLPVPNHSKASDSPALSFASGSGSGSGKSSSKSSTQQHIDPLSCATTHRTDKLATTTERSDKPHSSSSSISTLNTFTSHQQKRSFDIPEGLPPLNLPKPIHNTKSNQQTPLAGEKKKAEKKEKKAFNTTVPPSGKKSSSVTASTKIAEELSNATSVALPPLQPSSLKLKKKSSGSNRIDTPVPVHHQDREKLPPLPY